jgi:type IV pilus assembly protein PilM
MSWFKRNDTSVLGIDISTVAVKLLELSKIGSRYRVESYALVPLPQDSVVDKNITDSDAVVKAIKTAVRQSKTKQKNVCVAVGGSSVMSKVIQMPADLNSNEMEDQIFIEADQYVPYALDEVNLDFEIQGINAMNSDQVDVILAASRQENVNDRIEVLTAAGLNVNIVDIEAFAMENAFVLLSEQLPKAIETQNIAVIDIGATLMTLNVLDKCRTIYVREQGFGGKQLTEEIQRRYGLSYEEAGLAKRQGGLPDNYTTDVLEPFKQAIVQQISRTLQFFTSSSVNKAVDSLILAGGCASIQGLEKIVEENMGIKTYVANPFINMALSSRVKPQSLSNDAPAMMIVSGLALRSFD